VSRLVLVAVVLLQAAAVLNDGFQPVDDLIAIGTVALLVFLAVWLQEARRRRALNVADHMGQPITVLRGYLSMLVDGSLPALTPAQCAACYEQAVKLAALLRTLIRSL
jgi:hypothetical protein